MTTVLSEAASLIDEYLGNPQPRVLDSHGMHRLAIEASSFYKQQLGASGHLLTGEFIEVDPPAREFSLSEEGFTAATYVQRLRDGDADKWEKVDVVGIEDIDNENDLGRLAICFIGREPLVRLSWNPGDLTPSTLRIWHDLDTFEPESGEDDLDLPLNMLKYMVAHKAVLLALPRLALKAPTVYTVNVIKILSEVSQGQLQEYQSEFDTWRFNRESEGWSQVEGFDEQFLARRRRRFF